MIENKNQNNWNMFIFIGITLVWIIGTIILKGGNSWYNVIWSLLCLGSLILVIVNPKKGVGVQK